MSGQKETDNMNNNKSIEEAFEELKEVHVERLASADTGSYLHDVAKELHQLNINIKALAKEVGKRR